MADQEFDTSEFAFLYFAVSVLIMVLIPLTYDTLKYPIKTFIFKSHKRDPRYKRVSSHPSALKKIELDSQETKFRWFTPTYVFEIFVWLLLIMVFINTWNQLPDPELMRGFDPYDVLGVSRQANTSEIKKAYRKLALLYHPDKTQTSDDRLFIKVTKAYECLENPKKLQNCMKYGSPDGYKGFQIGIALPSFIFDPKDSAMYLILILGSFCLTVVGTLYSVFTSMGKYDRNSILLSNLRVYKESLTGKQLGSLKGCCEMVCKLDEIEFKGDLEIFKELNQLLGEKKIIVPKDSVSNVLFAYLLNLELNKQQNEILYKILKSAPNGLQSAAEYALKGINKIRSQNQPTAQPFSVKELSNYTIQCLRAQSHIIQGVLFDDEPTTQLSNPKVKLGMQFYEAVRNKKQVQIHSIQLLKDSLSETVEELALFPDVTFSLTTEKFDPDVEVDDLHTSDLFLVKYRIEHHSPSMFVHSNKYPYIKEHHWHIILLFRDEIIQYNIQTDRIAPLESPIINGEFKVVPYFYTMDVRQTKFVFQVLIFSDSYLDLEFKKDVSIVAKSASERVVEEEQKESDEDLSETESIPKNKHKKD